LTELKVGDVAPDFILSDERGLPVSLKDYLGKKVVVLYFYPKDFTSGCTAEACGFRDDYGLYRDKGAVVTGVSLDSVESHVKFSEKYKLPFTILSDSSKEAAKAYGVLRGSSKSTRGIAENIVRERPRRFCSLSGSVIRRFGKF
jgi:peroxiredoxin Q/BCP